jgi:hypothetical protein
MFAKDPEKPLQDRLAEIEREEKQIRTESGARLKELAAEKVNIHTKVTVVRNQKLETARVKMAERLRPIDEQLAKLRDKQRDLQERRQYDAASALVAEAAELHRQRRAIVAA